VLAGAFEREFTLPDVRLFPEPAQGGLSACADGAAWLEPLGRFDDALPNPCGARPRSVAFPCADQFRDPALFVGRLVDALPFADALPFTEPRPFTPAPAVAEGGRLLANSRCREDIAPVFGEVPVPLRAPKPALFPPRFTPEFTEPFATCPADNVRVSMVRTGI
jgi:hypothetical protein